MKKFYSIDPSTSFVIFVASSFQMQGIPAVLSGRDLIGIAAQPALRALGIGRGHIAPPQLPGDDAGAGAEFGEPRVDLEQLAALGYATDVVTERGEIFDLECDCEHCEPFADPSQRRTQMPSKGLRSR